VAILLLLVSFHSKRFMLEVLLDQVLHIHSRQPYGMLIILPSSLRGALTVFPAGKRGGAPFFSWCGEHWKSGDTSSKLIGTLSDFLLFLSGLAWGVIPHKYLGYFSPEFTYDSWRIYIALCTIPSLTSALAFVLMPESPKFLLMVSSCQDLY
jgi:hypothetical protein